MYLVLASHVMIIIKSDTMMQQTKEPKSKTGEQKAEEFISRIPEIRFLRPTGKPEPAWKLVRGSSWNDARRVASQGARQVEPNDSAWDFRERAAWRAIGEVLKDKNKDKFYRIRDLANETMFKTVSNAVPGEQVEQIALEARGYASLMAVLLLLEPGNGLSAHMNIAKSTWEVWERGYGYACEVRGVMYVYASLKDSD